ncbi:hypothetical protein MESS2_430006 [Mesorhizobium metallidurans STM 2683]|uniref:Uncharacterized protein n=1 Tax=Mesorhizobium metallidurans STM 2683 TaxID=1297569 RepID=M5ERH6_9HYPH|nr:hypothetical protein MESS2_430006 [Mesorhizobium metallidurans STM 2683]
MMTGRDFTANVAAGMTHKARNACYKALEGTAS